MSGALKDVRGKMPVSLVLTKSDLIENYTRNGLTPIENIINLTSQSELVKSVLVPIACTPRRLRNVEAPTLFSLQVAIQSRIDSLQAELEQLKEKKKEQRSEYLSNSNKASGIFGGIRDLVKEHILEEEPYRTKAERSRAKLEETEKIIEKRYSVLKPLREPSNALSVYTNKLISVQQGCSLGTYAIRLSKLTFSERLGRLLHKVLKFFSRIFNSIFQIY
ncbi:hypothetical protein PN466_09005 [Roseofilum reptotaenium CS-1145]|nr:hypothetical protein [Roseofilum reptotaenium CS-1145]